MNEEASIQNQALKFVILIGIVSLCADATYEGGRSISGAYLGFLGASGTVVGLVAGTGELIGFGLRLLTGYLSDKTRQYWRLTTLGYIINTAAIPLLAFTGRWETAAVLLLAERTGKAIRTPPRDVLLSHAAMRVGGGFGFGLHEALDQIGAVSGPLAVAAVLAWQQRYQPGFAVLVVPSVLGLIVLLIVQKMYPNPREFETKTLELSGEGLPRQFWVYLVGVMLVGCGYADFPLIAFHFQTTNLSDNTTIPLFYAIAMAVDAIAALILGRLFDRKGIIVLVGTFLLSAFFAPLAFLGHASLALFGMVLWGIGMGAQESIVKAAIATMVPSDKRGSAFGIFYLCYGLAWFIGSALMGVLHDRSLVALIGFSIATQFIAALILLQVSREARSDV
jgi:MFS family permease